jgi:hypothetical protein
MPVSHVEVLVEEPSMEAALRLLLPRLLGGTSFEVYPYQCNDDLLKRLPHRLQGYSTWLPADWRITVVVDRDNDDCRKLKRRLEKMGQGAGLTTRTAADGKAYQVVNRLAIEELEAWYFGDWSAVRTAYPRVSSGIPGRALYRNPDSIRGGTWERFERILQQAGYFIGGLRKIEAARAIAAHWDPDGNTSPSFKCFRDVVREMAAQ